MRGGARFFGLVAWCALCACGRWGFESSTAAGDGDGDGDGDADAAPPETDAAVRPSVPRAWTTATPANSPGQILTGKLTYFPPNQSVLLYGGTRVINDVPNSSAALWEYDGADWTMICDPCGPGPRVGHEYVFDVSQGLSLMFGGSDGNGGGLADVWHYSENTGWRVHVTSGVGPNEMVNFSAVYDVARGVNVVITQTNEVFELDGTVWSGPLETVPGQRSDAGSSATYDPSRGGVLVYGGRDGNGDLLDDAWLWDGTRWTSVCTDCTGQPRSGASVVYDAALREVLVIGGAATDEIAGTWTLGEPTSVDDAPSARANAAAAYDLDRDVVVLFGGRSPDCGGAFDACSDTLEMVLAP